MTILNFSHSCMPNLLLPSYSEWLPNLCKDTKRITNHFSFELRCYSAFKGSKNICIFSNETYLRYEYLSRTISSSIYVHSALSSIRLDAELNLEIRANHSASKWSCFGSKRTTPFLLGRHALSRETIFFSSALRWSSTPGTLTTISNPTS